MPKREHRVHTAYICWSNLGSISVESRLHKISVRWTGKSDNSLCIIHILHMSMFVVHTSSILLSSFVLPSSARFNKPCDIAAAFDSFQHFLGALERDWRTRRSCTIYDMCGSDFVHDLQMEKQKRAEKTENRLWSLHLYFLDKKGKYATTDNCK